MKISLSKRFRVSLLITPTVVLSVAAAFATLASAKPDAMTVWEEINDRSQDSVGPPLIVPSVHRTLRLNKSALVQALAGAPMEFTREATENPSIITLPLPDGTMARFRFEESPIMEPALALQHPEIKTYSGQGIDDMTAAARFDQTPLGLHAIVLSRKGTVFIDPLSPSDPTRYIAYYNHDISTEGFTRSCLISDAEIAAAERRGIHQESATPDFVTGPTLRSYRLAVAATGEFTQQYGAGDVNATLAKIVTMINQVSALYRKEAAITFQLIANETSIIFTDPVTDGYTNDTPSTMLAENQAKLDMVIGSANYDIGHVFGGRTSNSFSGVASLGVPCSDGIKGRGVSTMGGNVSTFPPSIFVSLVSHEIGHQFSARHSFNSTTSGCSGNRDSAGAYEPGSGSTIMGYSTCGSDNLQSFPDMYFHTGSLERIAAYSAGTGNCASTTATGNNAPVIATLSNFSIPVNTPFTLTANVTDPDGDAMTCVWEEYDLGAASPPNTDDGTRPIFRSFLPNSSTARTFPKLQYILANANVPPPSYSCGSGTCLTGEVLPSTTRTMHFRFTARDNRAAAGGAANAPMDVTISSAAGPFVVTQPNTMVSWPGGSAQLVTWNVANTANAPINCTNVKISLSTDGGNTFPFTLAASTPNDGSEMILIPNVPATTTARMKVEAVGNIFFDISDANFTITTSTQTPTPTATPTPIVTPTPTPTSITISGTVSYCPNPALSPVPNVTLTLIGSAGGTTLSDGSGNYLFASLPSGGSYTVTPTKAARAPGSAGINTVDVIAIQRQFLNIGTPLSGCPLTAADVNGDTVVSTIDVVATQRFFIGETAGTANVGKYQFSPTNHTYSNVVSNQVNQNYNALAFGDVAAPFVE